MSARDQFLGLLLLTIVILFAAALIIAVVGSSHRLGALVFAGMLLAPLLLIDWQEK